MMERLADPATATAAPTQTTNDAPAPAAIVEQPVQQSVQQPAATDDAATASAADGTFMLRSVLAAVAALGLLTWAICSIIGVRRRRTDVLNKAQHLNALPREMPAAGPAPTFQPLPPMNLMPRQPDDVEEALQRFSQRLRRRAAAA
jgi:hypothetical protein